MPGFAVIGLGSFGFYAARFLSENGHEVLAIDKNESQIDKIKPYVEKAVITDATNKDVLEQLGIKDLDAAIVSVGDHIDTSVLITLYLKEMKMKKIVVKSITEDHGKILHLVGATEVVFPERDSALKIAESLISPNVLDTLDLGPDYSIVELAPPITFLRKSIRELDIRNKYSVQVVAIKELIPENIVLVPPANYIIKDSDILILIGKLKDIEKVKQLK